MSFKPKKHVMLSMIEAVYGTDPGPTGAANAILISNPKPTPMVPDKAARTGLKPYLGALGQVIAGKHGTLDYDVEIAGSGTAGAAPGFAPNLKACAMQEITLAAAVTGTAQAGSANTITLAAADSGADNAYQYLRIKITGGTGVAGEERVIRSNVSSTKVATVYEDWTTPPDATTTYEIMAQVAYAPVSSGEQSITDHFNVDGLQFSMTGVRSDLAMKFAKGAIPMFSFKDLGLYVTPTDTALPAATLSGFQTPQAVNNANTVATLHGYSGIFSDISLALNNVNTYRNDIGTEEIYFSERAANGSVVIEHPTMAAKDFYSIVAAETLGSLEVKHGTAAGKKVAVYCPAVQLLDPTLSEDVVQMQNLALDVQPVDGNDELIVHVY